MAKKREVKEQTPPLTAPGLDMASGLGTKPSATVTRPPKEYTVGLWANLPQYVCNACGFDTLDPGVMQEHLFWQHSEIVEMEGAPLTANLTPQSPFPPIPDPSLEGKGERKGESSEEVFEVELEEIGSTVDEQGNEIKKFTVKEK